MPKLCFCGCGREVPFGRKRIANALGAQYDKDLALFAGARETEPDPGHRAELDELVATGRPLRDGLRDVVHGTLDRKDYDREAGKAWLERCMIDGMTEVAGADVPVSVDISVSDRWEK